MWARGEAVGNWSTIIIPALVGIATAIIANGAGWLLTRAQRQKLRAEAADLLTARAMEMVDRIETSRANLAGEVARLKAEAQVNAQEIALLTDRVQTLENQVAQYAAREQALRSGIEALCAQVAGLGGEPIWPQGDVTGSEPLG